MIIIEKYSFKLHWKIRLLGSIGCLMPIIGIIYYNNSILRFISILFTLMGAIGIADALTTVIIIDDDKLIYRYMFKSRILFWKDIRHIQYNIQSQGKNVGVYLLKADEGVVYGKTITISSVFEDYKMIINYAINRCKDNPFIRIDTKVYDIVKHM